MQTFRKLIFWITLICLVLTLLGIYIVSGIDPERIQLWLEQAGVWGPIVYILLYIIATIFILPSTPLNLSGGAIFGAFLGTLWTSIAAIIAATIAFLFTRTFGRNYISQKLAGRWHALDAEFQAGGCFYVFAIRLLPIIPYGLVNFAAGLTSIRFRSYFLGTILGTVPGVLPFVLMGSFGVQALRTGEILPLFGAFSLAGLLIAVATWYRRRRSFKG